MNDSSTAPESEPQPVNPIRIGVSACVIGHEVRWNGGHKRSEFVHTDLGTRVEFVPVCPEVEMGLSTPRETVRLVKRGVDELPGMISPKSSTDHTERMRAFAKRRVQELKELDLSGFIVQKGSPSCGMSRVRVYPPEGGMPDRNGRGLFTEELMTVLPELPVEEDGRLNDTLLREHFLQRIFAFSRLRDLFRRDWKTFDLVEFHSREKLLVLSHSDYRPLGKVVAHRRNYASQDEWGQAYRRLFLDALAKPATLKKHVNVLQHVVGYFRRGLDTAARAEVAELIEAYRLKIVPLVVPMTLIRHHARELGLSYLNMQTYLHGQPRELLPSNHLAG